MSRNKSALSRKTGGALLPVARHYFDHGHFNHDHARNLMAGYLL
jgi:hypothetical protein